MTMETVEEKHRSEEETQEKYKKTNLILIGIFVRRASCKSTLFLDTHHGRCL